METNRRFVVGAVLGLLCLGPVAASGLSPSELWALRREAAAAERAQDWRRAAEILGRLLEEDSGNVELRNRLGRAEARGGDSAAALGAFMSVEERGFVGSARRSYEIARTLARSGQREQALNWLERALAARFEDRPRLLTDEAWTDLRAEPRFRELAGAPPAGLSREQGWRFDLDYLVGEARRLHAGPGRPAFSEAFERSAAQLRARIPELDDDAIALGIERLVAQLDDGHSYIHGIGEGSPVTIEQRTLPLRFYLFSDGLFVIEAGDRYLDLIGSRVLSFGGVPAARVLESVETQHGRDNEMAMRWLGVQFYLGSMRHLRALGAADEEGTSLRVVDAGGGEREVRVVPDPRFELRRKLRPCAGGAPPIWLERVDTNYWSRPMPELSAIYFQFNQVRDAEEGPSIAEFSRALLAQLRESGAKNLILDLRHNNGGNNHLTFPVVRAAVAFELADPAHRIWVISGRNTFSAAQNLLNRLERWTDAVVVGEPSSSSPNFVGEETRVELPWSRLQGSISSRFWQDSDPGDDRRWIDPDLPVVLSSADYFARRDPVLDALRSTLAGPPVDDPARLPVRAPHEGAGRSGGQ